MNIRPQPQSPQSPLPTLGKAPNKSQPSVNSAVKPDANNSLGGLLSGFGSSKQAYRVKADDSLQSIAKKHLKAQATPDNIQRWVDHATALNQLDKAGAKLKTGQALLLPSIFSVTMGSAKTNIDFVDAPDPEELLKKEAAFYSESVVNLENYPVAERLKHFLGNPQDKPSLEDIRWLNKLADVENNINHAYKAPQSISQLKEKLNQATTWREKNILPTRLTKQDINSLSTQSQALLKTVMLADGQGQDLSQLDLSTVKPEHIKKLMENLKPDGYSLAEQKLVQILQDLSAGALFSHNKAFEFEAGTPHMLPLRKSIATSEIDTDLQQKQIQNRLAVKREMSQTDHIERGSWNPLGKEPLAYRYTNNNKLDAQFSRAEFSSERARETLLDTYGLAPEQARDLSAVKSVASKLNTPEKVADFISNYMTANFVHSGSTTWSSVVHLKERMGESEDIFFGETMLDKLPDGRALIDCEGFSKLSQLLLKHLAPEASALPVKMPGHIFTVAKIGNDTYLFDNDNQQKMDFSSRAKTNFKNKLETFSSSLDYLNPLNSKRLSRHDFKALYSYASQHHFKPDDVPKGDFLKIQNPNDTLQDPF